MRLVGERTHHADALLHAEAVFLANRVVVLSKGRKLEEIGIDLPRPRSWDALNENDAFKALCGRVLQLVRAA
jgi:NitT/TauT family transport system ATP-binding protein